MAYLGSGVSALLVLGTMSGVDSEVDCACAVEKDFAHPHRCGCWGQMVCLAAGSWRFLCSEPCLVLIGSWVAHVLFSWMLLIFTGVGV